MKPMLYFSIGLVLLAGFSSDKTEIQYGPIRIPGEFEPHQAIWLGYKSAETFGQDSASVAISDQMIKALNPYIHLNLVVEHDTLFPEGMAYFDRLGLDTLSMKIIIQSPTDEYFRDPGPIFGYTPKGELAIADFRYTMYMNVIPDSISEYAIGHDGIDRDVARCLGIPIVKSIVALEGGAFETNGNGTLIQCEAITLKRNPHLSREEIEADFRKNFGITQVIWLPSGLADDPLNLSRIQGNYWGFGTGGHTDEFVRFANDSTILLAWIDEDEKEAHALHALNYDILSNNYNILSKHRDANGNPFRIIKVPHPEPDVEQWIADSTDDRAAGWWSYYQEKGISVGDTILWIAASSYLNYVITNGIVIIPEYWEEGKPKIVKVKDLRVRAIFETLYPEKEVVGINPLTFNFDGGGMHCRYQSQPAVK